MISSRKAGKLAKQSDKIVGRLGQAIGVDARLAALKPDKSNEEMMLEIVRVGAHFLVIFTEPDMFPSITTHGKRAGAKNVKRSLNATTGQRPSVFLAYALTAAAASSTEGDEREYHLRVLQHGLPTVLPLSGSEMATLESCATLWRLGESQFDPLPPEEDWVRLPALYCLSLQSGLRGRELAEQVAGDHSYFAYLDFANRSLQSTIRMLIGDDHFAALEPSLVQTDMRAPMQAMTAGADPLSAQLELLALWSKQLEFYADLVGTPAVRAPTPPRLA